MEKKKLELRTAIVEWNKPNILCTLPFLSLISFQMKKKLLKNKLWNQDKHLTSNYSNFF